MPHSLTAILAHVHAQGRPGSHQAVLVREIERLRAEVAELKQDLDAATEWLRDIYRPTTVKETTDV
jgi:hypothetical protein